MKALNSPSLIAVPMKRLYRMSVRKYHQMIEAGVLTEDHRIELLEGYLVEKMAHNPPHDSTLFRMTRSLDRILGNDWILRNQSAITTKDSEPEPDITVATGPEEKYFRRHPEPADIAMLVEVSDASLQDDRYLKGRLYARARIPIYWIANLEDRQIEVFANPKGGRFPVYQDEKIYRFGEEIPLILQGKEIARIPVKDLLP